MTTDDRRPSTEDRRLTDFAIPQSITMTSPNAPDHDVLRLQVAMDEALRVRERDRLADALEEPQTSVRSGSARRCSPQRPAPARAS